MLELPICEKTSLKSFIKVLRTYGLDQQRPSNIKRLKNSRLKTQVLVDQQEQTLELRITKEEPLELDHEVAHTRLTKEERQVHDHH
jgi:UDP-3-O-acyl-N-acetylglucosamine deacetylase